MLKISNINELEIFFVVEYEMGNQIVHDELIPNGANIKVDDDNLHEYILKRYLLYYQELNIYKLKIKFSLMKLNQVYIL